MCQFIDTASSILSYRNFVGAKISDTTISCARHWKDYLRKLEALH
jgi:hypothetical protein